MTAHGTIETAVDAVQRGAFDYLTKPFVRDELRAKIGRALASRRWARDRERLLAVGQTLASSGIMARVLDAVAQAAVETTEAERCVVFQQEHGRLVPMASSGSPPPSWPALEAAAARRHGQGRADDVSRQRRRARSWPPRWSCSGDRPAPWSSRPPARVEPTDDDLELLALFSSQAAVAIRNTHELERLRSGALAALGRMATQVAHELKNPLAGLRLYARHLEQRLAARRATVRAPSSRRRSRRRSTTSRPWSPRSPPSAGRPSCTACRRRSTRCSTSASPSRRRAARDAGRGGRPGLRSPPVPPRRCSTHASCARRS